MLPIVVDENLKLILPSEQDAVEIAALVQTNLTHLKTWMPWVTDDYSLESAREYINQNLQNLARNAGFGMSMKYKDKIIGQIGFHDLDQQNRLVHTGYWIAANVQGRGIVTKCCRVLINQAFLEQKLNRVQINCNVANTKSRAVAERLGFKFEGVLREAQWLRDKFVDMAVYSILAKEWSKQ